MRIVMKNIRIILIIVIGYLVNSCNEDIILMDVDCSQCYTQRPEYASMKIKVTINEENPEVPITIFLGSYEKNQVRLVDTATSPYVSVDLIPARNYSIRAEYHVGDKTIYAIDGDEIELKKVSSQCDSVCWIIDGGEVDVRLKFQDPDDLPD